MHVDPTNSFPFSLDDYPIETSIASKKLPAEMILKILSFLNAQGLCQMNRVNKNFYRLSLNPSLWIPLLEKDAPTASQEMITLYGERSLIDRIIRGTFREQLGICKTMKEFYPNAVKAEQCKAANEQSKAANERIKAIMRISV